MMPIVQESGRTVFLKLIFFMLLSDIHSLTWDIQISKKTEKLPGFGMALNRCLEVGSEQVSRVIKR